MTRPSGYAAGECNLLAIRQAARHVTQLYDHCLAECGLRGTQFSVLSKLDRRGPQTISELAAEMVMDRSTLGRNVRPLEQQGLITLEPDPRDRRARGLALTAAGRARLEQAREGWAKAQARFEAAFGTEQALQLRSALHAIATCDFGSPSEGD
jgi:DNA-binding MarR family transcriptional regulator